MKRSAPITALFLDIGGVLLTDGWDHHARKRAAAHFKLELTELENRHHLTFDTYEGWSSTKNDRSPGLSSGASCSRNRNLTPR
jgi:hypothetical protein